MRLDKNKKLSQFIDSHRAKGRYGNLTERQIRGRMRHVEESIAGHEKQITALRKTLVALKNCLSSE